MRLDPKAFGLGATVLFGGSTLVVALTNLAFPNYGSDWLQLLASIYPGYHVSAGLGSALLVTAYACIDGWVGGALLAWLYNRAQGAQPAGGGAR